jgi:hypothetical protein
MCVGCGERDSIVACCPVPVKQHSRIASSEPGHIAYGFAIVK